MVWHDSCLSSLYRSISRKSYLVKHRAYKLHINCFRLLHGHLYLSESLAEQISQIRIRKPNKVDEIVLWCRGIPISVCSCSKNHSDELFQL